MSEKQESYNFLDNFLKPTGKIIFTTSEPVKLSPEQYEIKELKAENQVLKDFINRFYRPQIQDFVTFKKDDTTYWGFIIQIIGEVYIIHASREFELSRNEFELCIYQRKY